MAGPNRSCFDYLAHVMFVCTLVSFWVYYTHCLYFKLLNCDLEPEGRFKESLINGYCYKTNTIVKKVKNGWLIGIFSPLRLIYSELEDAVVMRIQALFMKENRLGIW